MQSAEYFGHIEGNDLTFTEMSICTTIHCKYSTMALFVEYALLVNIVGAQKSPICCGPMLSF